jgi:hypothetical protein
LDHWDKESGCDKHPFLGKDPLARLILDVIDEN